MFLTHRKAGNPFINYDMRVINRTGAAVTVGEVLAFMLNLDVDGGTTDEARGGGPGTPVGTGDGVSTGDVDTAPYSVADALFANVDDVATVGENVLQCFAVVTDLLNAGGDGTEIVVRFQGVVTVDAVSANYDIGDELMVSSGANTVAALTAATGQRPIGVSLTEADSATSINALFFGWAGLFGGQHE